MYEEHISIPLTNQPRLYRLKAPYEEHFYEFLGTASGGSYHADFLIAFIPTYKQYIEIEIQAEEEQIVDVALKGFKNGFQTIINELAQYGLGFSGTKMVAKVLSYHPVDSKSLSYAYCVKRVLRDLLNTAQFTRKVLRYQALTSLYSMAVLDLSALQLPQKQIQSYRLPLNRDSIIVLQEVWVLSCTIGKSKGKEPCEVNVIVQPNYERSKQSFLRIYRDEGIDPSALLWINTQIQDFIRMVEEDGKSLGGLNIYITSNEEQMKLESHFQRIDGLAWALQNLLFGEGNIKIIDRTAVST